MWWYFSSERQMTNHTRQENRLALEILCPTAADQLLRNKSWSHEGGDKSLLKNCDRVIYVSSPQPTVDAFQNSFNLDPPTHNQQLPSSHAWVLKSIRAFHILPVCIPPSGWKAKVGAREPWTPESEKPRQRVSNADRKVFANPESFCDKFIIGWRISGYFAIQNIQIICKVSGGTGKFPDNLKSVRII